jgi:hypothetical protein
MRWLLVLAAVMSVSLAPHSARAVGPSATVRCYFDALGRNDFGRALALTGGAAETRTAQLLGSLERQAAAANASVELKVRRLAVSERPPAPSGAVPVDVSFNIDVIGKKWLFSRVARRLAGQAQFVVAPTDQRIVAITGSLR